MPVTAIINLRALAGGVPPRSFHALFHSLFLSRLSMADEAVGQALHDAGGMAPFSISPVMGMMAEGKVIENYSYWVRVCLLEPAVEDVFIRGLEQGVWSGPLMLGEMPFLVEDVFLGGVEGDSWTGRASYDELLFTRAAAPSRVSLRLESPTAFKRGDLHYPLPEPSLIFDNLARRWNLFSPYKIPEKPDCSAVSFAFANIGTKPFALRNGGTILGAVGKVTFIFAGADSEKHLFSALLRFAFYSGIGVKTSQGMGLCRPSDKPASTRGRDR